MHSFFEENQERMAESNIYLKYQGLQHNAQVFHQGQVLMWVLNLLVVLKVSKELVLASALQDLLSQYLQLDREEEVNLISSV